MYNVLAISKAACSILKGCYMDSPCTRIRIELGHIDQRQLIFI